MNMMFTKPLLLAALAKLSIAGYVLQDDYQPNSFFSEFDFFSVSDEASVVIATVSVARTLHVSRLPTPPTHMLPISTSLMQKMRD